MFQKNQHSENGRATAVGTTIIAAGTHCTGDVSSKSDLRIDGTIEGNVNCQSKVVIGTKGRVTGQIVCLNADVSGELEGNIQCTEGLVLRQQSKVNGNITCNMLQMESGVMFNGHCNMAGRGPIAKAGTKEEAANVTNSFIANHVN